LEVLTARKGVKTVLWAEMPQYLLISAGYYVDNWRENIELILWPGRDHGPAVKKLILLIFKTIEYILIMSPISIQPGNRVN